MSDADPDDGPSDGRPRSPRSLKSPLKGEVAKLRGTLVQCSLAVSTFMHHAILLSSLVIPSY